MQDIIDSQVYPPNCHYTFDGLIPSPLLKERLDLMPEEFWHGLRFLDIGCNKGFFSLYSKCRYKKAIETNHDNIELCKKLGINVTETSFRDYITDKQYDRIFLGNVMHYLYKDSGWDFICKLAVISNGLVLIEAPTGLECEDMNRVLPKGCDYNHKKFMSIMDKFFTLEYMVNSPSPDRYIMMFKRKPIQTLQFKPYQREILKEKDDKIIYETHKNKIVKLQKLERNSIVLASMSPISNGIISEIYEDGVFVGWTEEKSYLGIYEYKENQKELFKKICEHGIFLARNGYYDLDTATINFFKDNKMFDKGGIRPIKSITDKDLSDYLIMFKNSYDEIDIDSILNALKTMDSHKIEEAYQKWA